jgi:hypothetical protein
VHVTTDAEKAAVGVRWKTISRPMVVIGIIREEVVNSGQCQIIVLLDFDVIGSAVACLHGRIRDTSTPATAPCTRQFLFGR